MLALRAHDVSLELALDSQSAGLGQKLGFRSAVAGSMRRYVTVLSRVSFAAGEGDRIALLGLNGAGKSTLLRVLNGAYVPTHGRVEAHGTMQSLLNSTLGFAEQASVVENVMLRGTAMGLRRAQVQQALAGILDFAGLRERAQHRLHALSTGQRMRLGFAISTCVQPDILLMDEWIATGDAAFAERARSRLTRRFEDSRIVVMASHGTELQRRMCNKALVLDAGRLRFFGDIEEGIEIYGGIVAKAGHGATVQAGTGAPLLFGESVGMIERISIGASDVRLEGWALDSKGREVEVVGVEMAGANEALVPERVEREDVRLHLGKRSGRYGFRVALPRPGHCDDAQLLRGLRVRAGRSADRLGPPLPLAVAAVVETAMDRVD
ncbi:ABC transporter ATP-binding protein [Lysobacter enzymogenes]|nr:ABC transporter ATP-binding protein [Lysobacter enzymogenes]